MCLASRPNRSGTLDTRSTPERTFWTETNSDSGTRRNWADCRGDQHCFRRPRHVFQLFVIFFLGIDARPSLPHRSNHDRCSGANDLRVAMSIPTSPKPRSSWAGFYNLTVRTTYPRHSLLFEPAVQLPFGTRHPAICLFTRQDPDSIRRGDNEQPPVGCNPRTKKEQVSVVLAVDQMAARYRTSRTFFHEVSIGFATVLNHEGRLILNTRNCPPDNEQAKRK